MIHQKGFSLVETVVYCAIMSILSLLVFQFMIRSYDHMRSVIISGKQIMAMQSIERRLVNDIQSAIADANKWDSSQKNSFVCQNCQESIGWELIEGNMYRISGVYDFTLHRWRSKSRALVGTQIDHFLYTLLFNAGLVIGVKYVLERGNTEHSGAAFVYNGVIT